MATILYEHVTTQAFLITILYLIPFAFSNDGIPIPADKGQVEAWFNQNVPPLSAGAGSLDPALVAAEASVRVINMKSDGTGDFKTITDAINSIPDGNAGRVYVYFGPGKYPGKVKIEKPKGFITFMGDAAAMPELINDGTAKQWGTFYSATLTVESDYFSAVNIQFTNSAPRPVGVTPGQQAVAMRIGGDKASFYNCRFIGFQDTLCDDVGRHFFKDCYIEGTVDFIFGAGRSLYLNCEVRIIPGDDQAIATAQGSETKLSTSGYSFVHCTVTGGTGGTGFLGRAWRSNPQVVFAYSELSDAVNPAGWSNNLNPAADLTSFYGEYQNSGPKSDLAPRYPFLKKFTERDASSFLTLGYILGSMWLLPPPATVPAATGPATVVPPGAAAPAAAIVPPGAAAPGAATVPPGAAIVPPGAAAPGAAPVQKG